MKSDVTSKQSVVRNDLLSCLAMKNLLKLMLELIGHPFFQIAGNKNIKLGLWTNKLLISGFVGITYIYQPTTGIVNLTTILFGFKAPIRKANIVDRQAIYEPDWLGYCYLTSFFGIAQIEKDTPISDFDSCCKGNRVTNSKWDWIIKLCITGMKPFFKVKPQKIEVFWTPDSTKDLDYYRYMMIYLLHSTCGFSWVLTPVLRPVLLAHQEVLLAHVNGNDLPAAEAWMEQMLGVGARWPLKSEVFWAEFHGGKVNHLYLDQKNGKKDAGR